MHFKIYQSKLSFGVFPFSLGIFHDRIRHIIHFEASLSALDNAFKFGV